MTRSVIDKLVDLFEADRAIARVEEDPVLSAELLLLFRMVLADGNAGVAEIHALKRICRDVFAIGESSLDHVVEHLREFGEETSVAQSLATFRRLDEPRRRRLARHMAEIAHVDEKLQPQEKQLLARTLDLLGLNDA